MVGVEEFLEDLVKTEPVAIGLVTLNAKGEPGQVIEVENPRFMYPLPVKFDYPVRRLLLADITVIEEVVVDMKAVPIEIMPLWWSFAIYE